MTDPEDRPDEPEERLSDSDISDLCKVRDLGLASVYTVRRTKRARFRRLGLLAFDTRVWLTKTGQLLLRKVGKS